MARQSRAPARAPPLPPLLLTRPAAQGDRFAGLLRTRFGTDLRILLSPLIAPEFLSPPLPVDPAGLLFTSESGVAGLARLWRGGTRPAWCVGDRTAAAARAAGFEARSAAGDAAALVAMLAAEAPPGLLLYARGRDSRGDVAGALVRQGLRVAEAIVYAQVEQPLSAAARALLCGAAPVAVPLFSPRTAGLLAAAITADRLPAPVWIAALSPAVAEAAAAARPARLVIARRPDAPAMVEALAGLAVDAQP
jgi:uroporphyrinogen-III synthase